MILNIPALQKRLKVTADGKLGPVTLTALFAAFGAKPPIATALAQGAVTALPTYKITDTGLRLAHFMGQLAHESGGFRYMEEIASGAAYEGRRSLGNVRPGDGIKFKGRGPIQLSGRANYTLYGEALGLDFVNHPEMVAQPEIGILVAARYWAINGLNGLADADKIETITRRINGGKNGLDDRKLRTVKAKALIL